MTQYIEYIFITISSIVGIERIIDCDFKNFIMRHTKIEILLFFKFIGFKSCLRLFTHHRNKSGTYQKHFDIQEEGNGMDEHSFMTSENKKKHLKKKNRFITMFVYFSSPVTLFMNSFILAYEWAI